MDAHKKACSHTWHFEMQINGTAVNDEVMEKFVNGLETIIIREEEYVVGNDNNEYVVKGGYNHIVKKFDTELNGKYYEIMYGKKKAKENREETKD